MNKHFKLLFPSKIPANRQHATLTSITSANMAQIAATKIVKRYSSDSTFQHLMGLKHPIIRKTIIPIRANNNVIQQRYV